MFLNFLGINIGKIVLEYIQNSPWLIYVFFVIFIIVCAIAKRGYELFGFVKEHPFMILSILLAVSFIYLKVIGKV